MLLACSIYPSTPALFHPQKVNPWPFKNTPKLRAGIWFAEMQLGDLICQNDCAALEFRGYGKTIITPHGFRPDSFVQMAFKTAYFRIYGMPVSISANTGAWFDTLRRTKCTTYEPAMTKTFSHGRMEAIRTVQPESVHFVKASCNF